MKYTYDNPRGTRLIALALGLLMGALPTLAYFDLIKFGGTRKHNTAVFEDPRHWPVLVFGITFFLIGLQFNIPKEKKGLMRTNGNLIILGLSLALIGTLLHKFNR